MYNMYYSMYNVYGMCCMYKMDRMHCTVTGVG